MDTLIQNFSINWWLIGGLLFLFFILFPMLFRVIVPPEYADVIIKGKKRIVYCSAPNIGDAKSAIYWRIPKWVPVIGILVKRIPLKVIEIQIKDYETFAQRNARFICDVSVYGKVVDPQIAVQRWPGNSVAEFQDGIKEIIVAAIRNTTTKFPVEDVIAKKEEIAAGIQKSLEQDMLVYGFDVTNVAVVGISDPPNGSTTVIRDISAKMEAEINSESRKQIAIKKKDAEIVEAEAMEKSEVRKKEAEKMIGEAEQQKQTAISIAEQQAREESMKVEKIRLVRSADIRREAMIVDAEGQKISVIRVKEGESEGISMVGNAEANIIKAKGLAEAEAKEKMGAALNRFNESAKQIRDIEKEERIGVAGMSALSQADIKLVSTGHISSFLDLFSAKGGANIAAMLESFQKTNPEAGAKLMAFLGSAFTKKIVPVSQPGEPEDPNG